MKKNILLTFDYELFLGKDSGSVLNCLIKPTNAILEILNKVKATAIFFIDATYLWRLETIKGKYIKAEEDYLLIKKQINQLSNYGHHIFIHIHPHWLDAQYKSITNRWDLSNNTKFSFNNLSQSEKDTVFTSSYNALINLLEDSNNIRIVGFRAGGLYIQPFSDFKPYFIKYGIKYDFSVLPGFTSANANYSFNYGNILNDKAYKFSDQITTLDNFGEFYETPISVFTMSFIFKLVNSIWYRFILKESDKQFMGDGSSSGNVISSKNINMRKYFKTKETYSVEMLNTFKAILYSRVLKHRNYIHFISHPKLTSTYNIFVFDKWISHITNKYVIESNFHTF